MSDTEKTIASVDGIREAFDKFSKSKTEDSSAWLNKIRKQGFENFQSLGLPTLKDEDWKYTSLERLRRTDFDFESAAKELSAEELKPFLLNSSDWHLLVFVNGKFSEKLSSKNLEVNGIHVGSLANAIQSSEATIQKHLLKYAQSKTDGLTALNEAFIEDGAFIHLSKSAVLDKPIHLLFVSTTEAGPSINQIRNLIVAEPMAQATIVQSMVSLGEDTYWNNGVSEVFLAEGAKLETYQLYHESAQAFSTWSNSIYQNRDSSFSADILALGSGLSRNNMNIVLDGEGAECALNGLYMTAGKQHADSFVVIDHKKPHGSSRQLFKGILQDQSKCVFSGKIFVHPDAQKTDAEQTNKNLLLSDEASVDTKPQLEIFADDVKCAHGAAIGQLEEDAIFYFQSRGIDQETAKKLLTFGFANEVIEQIKLKEVRKFIRDWLPQYFDRKVSE